MAFPIISHKDRIPWGWAVAVYSLLLVIVLACQIREGIVINDEIAYLMMADSVNHGTFRIWNGYEEYNSEELVLASTVPWGGGLYGVPSPIYPLLVWPFYRIFGVWGLILVNTLCFAAVTMLVYLLSQALFKDGMFSASAAIFYSLFSYSMMFSLELWPHMFSVFLVMVSAYLVLSGRLPLLAGVFAGLSACVRYSNILLALAFLAYLLYARRRGESARFIIGSALPLALAAVLNQSMFGSLFRTAYTSRQVPLGYPAWALTPYLLVLSFAAFAAYSATRYFTRGNIGASTRSALVTVILLGAVLYCMDAAFLERLWVSAKVAYSEVFDIQSHPLGDVPPTKRSLIQASPILALAVIAPYFLRRKLDQPTLALICAIPVLVVLFYSCFAYMHGGRIWFVRYLLECTPTMSIMAAYVAWTSWSDDLRRYWLAFPLCLMGFLMVGPLQFINTEFASLFARYLPQALALLLLGGGLWSIYSGRTWRFLPAVIVVASVYGLSVNVMDTVATYSMRDRQVAIVEEMRFVRNDSAFMVFNNIDVISGGMLKLDRKVRIAETIAGTEEESADLVAYYSGRKVPVYFMDDNSTEFRSFYNSTISSYNPRFFEGNYSRIYSIGG